MNQIRRAFDRLRQSKLAALVLGNRNYRLYTSGNCISLIGMWMQRISIGWLTWQLTHSGFWLGAVAFADFAPVMAIGPLAGTFADRIDRVRLIRVTQTLLFGQAAALWLLTLTGHISIPILIALVALQGILHAATTPARLAFVPSLVSEGELPTAVAMNSIVFNVARFAGPLLAGWAILAGGVATAFLMNALSYLVFLLALSRIDVDDKPVAQAKQRSLRADLGEGLGYTFRHPAIGPLLLLLVAIGLGGRPISDLMPGIVDRIFGAGAGGLSLMVSATGAGAIVGAAWIGSRTSTTPLAWIAAVTSATVALAATGVIVSPSLTFAAAAMFLFGAANTITGVVIQTGAQLASAREMRGRVMGLYALIFRGAPAIGALTAGTLSQLFGLRAPILIGAVLVLAAAFATWTRRRQISAALAPSFTVKEKAADEAKPAGG